MPTQTDDESYFNEAAFKEWWDRIEKEQNQVDAKSLNINKLRNGTIKKKIIEGLRTRGVNTYHQTKMLMAMGGIAPGLIIKDGSFSPKGVLQDVLETTAVVAVGEVPFIGPIAGAALSLLFSSLNNPENKTKDDALIRQISKIIDDKIDSALEVENQGKVDNYLSSIKLALHDFHTDLYNKLGYNKYYEISFDEFKERINNVGNNNSDIVPEKSDLDDLKNHVNFTLGGLITDLGNNLVMPSDTKTSAALYFTYYRMLGIFAAASAAQIAAYCTLIEALQYCLAQKTPGITQQYIDTLTQYAMRFISEKNNVISDRLNSIAQGAKLGWNKTQPGIAIYAQKGGDFFTFMARLFYAKHQGMVLGSRLSAELFSPLSVSTGDDSNINPLMFSGVQNGFITRKGSLNNFTIDYHPGYIGRVGSLSSENKQNNSLNYIIKVPNHKGEKSHVVPGVNDIAIDKGYLDFIELKQLNTSSPSQDKLDTFHFITTKSGCAWLDIGTGVPDMKKMGKQAVESQNNLRSRIKNTPLFNPDNYHFLTPFKEDISFTSTTRLLFEHDEGDIFAFQQETPPDEAVSHWFDGNGNYHLADVVYPAGETAHKFPTPNAFAFCMRHNSAYEEKAFAKDDNISGQRVLEFDAGCGMLTNDSELENLTDAALNHNDPCIGRKVLAMKGSGEPLWFRAEPLIDIDRDKKWSVSMIVGFYGRKDGKYPRLTLSLTDLDSGREQSQLVRDYNTLNIGNIPSLQGWMINDQKMEFIIITFNDRLILPPRFKVAVICGDGNEPWLFASLCFSSEPREITEATRKHEKFIDSLKPFTGDDIAPGDQK